MVGKKWLTVNDFTNYEVSNFGEVRNKTTNKMMKQCFDKNGYKLVNLSNNGKTKLYRVHRLVIETFLGKSELQVNHIDENKQNNRLSNLEYVTCKENINHGTRNKRVSKKLSKPVKQYDLDGNFIRLFYGVNEAERVTGVSNQNIGKCALGKYKTAGGYIWRY